MNRKAERLLKALDSLPRGSVVVEIGCVRETHEVPTDGWSTFHLAHRAADKGWDFHSVDIDPEAVARARRVTRAEVHLADGRKWLLDFAPEIDGLYLDGSGSPREAAAQYRAATLSDRAVVVVDDVQSFDGNEQGKGSEVLDVLEADGFSVRIFGTEPGYLMAVAKR